MRFLAFYHYHFYKKAVPILVQTAENNGKAKPFHDRLGFEEVTPITSNLSLSESLGWDTVALKEFGQKWTTLGLSEFHTDDCKEMLTLQLKWEREPSEDSPLTVSGESEKKEASTCGEGDKKGGLKKVPELGPIPWGKKEEEVLTKRFLSKHLR